MNMKKTLQITVIAVFIGFIALFFILNTVMPDREFSPRENRYLQKMPVFTIDALVSGSFTDKFEKYTTDQFVFRDTWIALKARSELFSGKQENNDVFYCGDGVLISRYSMPEKDVIEENVGFLNQLTEKISADVYFALIPGASEVQSFRLPENAPTDSQKDVIDAAYSLSNARNIDILTFLNDHRSEYIFYRTDHHWTSLGAFYGYEALRNAWGLESVSLSDYQRKTVSDNFYGTAFSSSGFTWVSPDSMETFVDDDGSAVITNYNSAQPEETPLYDVSFLGEKDKYAFFLGGNTPRLSIETGQAGKPRLCIIRDSYTDCLLPFLLSDFSRIDLLDLRYFKDPVSSYINSEGFDAVLVIYSVANFSTDSNLFMLGT